MLRDDPSTGTGKPEMLRHNLAGFWSRRLSQFDDKYVYIFAIGGHYDQLRGDRMRVIVNW